MHLLPARIVILQAEFGQGRGGGGGWKLSRAIDATHEKDSYSRREINAGGGKGVRDPAALGIRVNPRFA